MQRQVAEEVRSGPDSGLVDRTCVWKVHGSLKRVRGGLSTTVDVGVALACRLGRGAGDSVLLKNNDMITTFDTAKRHKRSFK